MIKVMQFVRSPELLDGAEGSAGLQYISITKKVYFLGILIHSKNWIAYGVDYSLTTY